MRKFLLAIVLLGLGHMGLAQKTFYYPYGTTIDEAGLAGGAFSTTLKFLKNAAGDPISFRWEVLSIDTNRLTPGATVDFGVCDNASCYTSVENQQFDMIPVSGPADYGMFKLQGFQVTGEVKIVVKVRVWDKNNPAVSDTIDMSWRTDNWVGVKEYRETNQVSVYPNPASNKLNVTYNLAGTSKGSFELVNLLGKTVFHKELNDSKGNFNLNIENISRGVYFYTIKNGSGKVMITKKVVVQ